MTIPRPRIGEFQCLTNLGLESLEWHPRRGATIHTKDDSSRRLRPGVALESYRLAQPPLDPIALNRSAGITRNDKCEVSNVPRGRFSGDNPERLETPTRRSAILQDLPDGERAFQSELSGETKRTAVA
jgi:hypothetical protein